MLRCVYELSLFMISACLHLFLVEESWRVQGSLVSVVNLVLLNCTLILSLRFQILYSLFLILFDLVSLCRRRLLVLKLPSTYIFAKTAVCFRQSLLHFIWGKTSLKWVDIETKRFVRVPDFWWCREEYLRCAVRFQIDDLEFFDVIAIYFVAVCPMFVFDDCFYLIQVTLSSLPISYFVIDCCWVACFVAHYMCSALRLTVSCAKDQIANNSWRLLELVDFFWVADVQYDLALVLIDNFDSFASEILFPLKLSPVFVAFALAIDDRDGRRVGYMLAKELKLRSDQLVCFAEHWGHWLSCSIWDDELLLN